MALGKKTGGRQKGSLNKTTAEVKKALTDAFKKLGGTPSLVTWGQENPTEFYKLWAKMLPAEVHAEVRNIEAHDPDDLADDELAAIAVAGRRNTAQAPGGPEGPDTVH